MDKAIRSNLHYLFHKKLYDEKIVSYIAISISYYYFLKNEENVKAMGIEVLSYGIKNIEYKKGILTIHTKRPGVFIGYKGQNINVLEKFLKEEKLEIMFAYKNKIYARSIPIEKIKTKEIKHDLEDDLTGFGKWNY
jgi:ribosomal protein S3